MPEVTRTIIIHGDGQSASHNPFSYRRHDEVQFPRLSHASAKEYRKANKSRGQTGLSNRLPALGFPSH